MSDGCEILRERLDEANATIATQSAQIEGLREACRRALPYMLETVLNQQAREDISFVCAAIASVEGKTNE